MYIDAMFKHVNELMSTSHTTTRKTFDQLKIKYIGRYERQKRRGSLTVKILIELSNVYRTKQKTARKP